MADQVNADDKLRSNMRRWASLSVIFAVAAVVFLPIAAIFVLALSPSEGFWTHLLSTVFPRYFGNSLILMFSVGAIAGMTGAGTAWIVTMYDFPLRRLFAWMLFLPLAVPAYIGAYALVDFFEYAGPLQSMLRAVFGWNNASQYYFPEIRSLGGAVLVLSAALYPYVYLFSCVALREQSMTAHDVASTLGSGPYRRFFRVGLPLIRPSIAAGVALVMMETVSDFGVVDYFAVQTLTSGIFSIWLDGRNIGGAAQLASVILFLMTALVAMDRVNRRRMRFTRISGAKAAPTPVPLRGRKSAAAAAACFLPIAVGFILPIFVIFSHALNAGLLWVDARLASAFANTLFTGGAAAAVTVSAALAMTYAAQLSPSRIASVFIPMTTLGYAVPGAVLGLGLLIPVAAADHWIAEASLALLGVEPGLLMTGSAFAIILAYCVRFFAIAQGAVDSAIGRVPPSQRIAARLLGRSPWGAMRAVYLPLIRGSLLTGVLLVFVDCVKELPATLLLRPFNYNTLATRVYEQASLENLTEASPAALLVTLVGALGVLLIAREIR